MQQDVTKILNRLSEYNSDFGSLLGQLEEIRAASMEGLPNEKVSAKDGVLTVLEVFPQVAVQAVRAKLEVIKFMVAIAEVETPDTQVTIEIPLLEPYES